MLLLALYRQGIMVLMSDLQRLISGHGDIKKFVEEAKISRCFFYEWRNGKKSMSLRMATQIVRNTKGAISFEDLASFEEKVRKPKKPADSFEQAQ